MKKNKILLIGLILIIGALFYNQVFAVEGARTLGARLKRPFTNLEYKFRSGNEGNDKVYTVVKIYDNEDKDEENNLLYNKALYCLRGGLGFGADDESDVSNNPIEYTQIGEMHENASSIIAKYQEYYSINLDRTETINEKEVNIYNAILWILDEAYLPKNIEKEIEGEKKTVYDAAEYKEELLTKIGITEEITDDDIEVMQQLAIWYFANYDEQANEIENSVSTGVISPAQRLSKDDNDNIDNKNSLDKIYQYFVYNAIENSTIYQGTDSRNKYVGENKFDKNIKLEIKSHDYQETRPNIYTPGEYYYEIGPFMIKNNIGDNGREKLDLTSIVLFDADEKTVKRSYKESSNRTRTVYAFFDANGEQVQELEKGIQYYIRFQKVFEKGFELSGYTNTVPEEEKYDVSKVSLKLVSTYSLSTAKFLIREDADQPVVEIEKEKKYESDILGIEEPKKFDLALRKYITKVERDGELVTIENPRNTNNIDLTKLVSGEKTTAEYKHRKDPVEVETGDIVTYRFTVYNEGDVAGLVYSITDYLPEGLEFDAEANPTFIEQRENPTAEELEGKEYVYKIEENKITIYSIDEIYHTVPENPLFVLNEFDGTTLDSKSIEIKLKVTASATNKDQVLTNVATMSYHSIGVMPVSTIPDSDSNRRGANNQEEEFTVPTAAELVAPLPGYKGDSKNQNDLSQADYHYAGQEDDDDFEKIIIKGKEFDLSLRKYISAVNGKAPETSRVPQIDTSKLNTADEVSGEKITTAIYKHSKEPLTVKKGDLVTYKIRIYNEGKRDGYATKVTDYLPDGLGFLYTSSGDINSDWFLPEGAVASPLYGEKGIYSSEDKILKKDSYKEVFGEDINLANIQVVQGAKVEDGERTLAITAGRTENKEENKQEIKATELIKAYGAKVENGDKWQQSVNNSKDGLFYQELEVTCIVLKENTYTGILKNVAEITAAKDVDGTVMINVGDDRDSEPNNVYEDQKHNPKAEENGYTAGEQDDDDFEPLQLKYFDLALRKFITGVETNGKTQNITARIPDPKIGEDGNIVYEHTKKPVNVANNDNVIYTIRVYNEGTIAGYAEEVTDDIPEGLMYLPEHSINNEYEWKMYDKDGNVTEKVEEAVAIKTDYLSQAKENKEEGEETKKRDNLIAPFDVSKEISTETPLNPDYRDVKIAFKVIEPNTSDRIITNSAQISKDSDDDIDSIPDKWNEGEDDQDKEHIYVKYFDLSLLKWVTKTVVTVDGKTTTTETGFKPNTGKTETKGIRDNSESEPIAKVEIDKKKLDKTTVKFVYKIRVTNEGEIEGYATEITDFIPKGLEFKEEDNKSFGWVKDGEDKVTTRALETVLLKPGESKEIEIVFTWKNATNNLGVKTNIAEITEDYNEHSSKDIDSTPNNKKDPYEKEQEDDDDFALVILSIKTGKGASYVILTTAMLTLLAGGIYLVKKYVLTY